MSTNFAKLTFICISMGPCLWFLFTCYGQRGKCQTWNTDVDARSHPITLLLDMWPWKYTHNIALVAINHATVTTLLYNIWFEDTMLLSLSVHPPLFLIFCSLKSFHLLEWICVLHFHLRIFFFRKETRKSTNCTFLNNFSSREFRIQFLFAHLFR